MVRFVVFVLMISACGTDAVPDVGNGSGDTGLPCDVVDALATCQGCHGSPPSGGAPMSLRTHRDLVRTSNGVTMAERALARMQDTAAPMPPLPAAPATAADLGALEAWVAAGMPPGDCTDPFAAPPVCTSGRTWSGEEGPGMDPGRACISCHQAEREGPRFTIAGTVYPTGHEPNNCYGSSGSDILIEITGANGAKQMLRPNGSGNFYSSTTISTPYTAKVIANGSERAMATPQTIGDCNSCHTQTGTMNAPGRIVLP